MRKIAVLFIFIAVLLAGCVGPYDSILDPATTITTPSLPADICVVNGIPMVEDMSYLEHTSAYSISYVRSNGDLVMKFYNRKGIEFVEGGSIVTPGAPSACPGNKQLYPNTKGANNGNL